MRLATFSIPSTTVFASVAFTFTSISALAIASMIRFNRDGRWTVKSFSSSKELSRLPWEASGSCGPT